MMRASSPMRRAGAEFRVAKAVCQAGGGAAIVWIEDLDRGRVSVTNDAENVVLDLQHDFPGYRIIYRDSTGRWDELRHVAGKFTGFAAAPGMDPSAWGRS